MRKLAILLLTAIPVPAEAERKDAQGRILPDTYPYAQICAMTQELLRPGAEALLFKFESVDMNTGKKSLNWNITVCPSCSDDKVSRIKFMKERSGLPSQYLFRSTDKDKPAHVIADSLSADLAKLTAIEARLTKACGSGSQEDSTTYRIRFTGDKACVNRELSLYLLGIRSAGPAALAALEKQKDKPALDFYQDCHRFLNQDKATTALQNTKHYLKELFASKPTAESSVNTGKAQKQAPDGGGQGPGRLPESDTGDAR